MSRPRKPYGATHPGRLPATMMKVLAAELSDPSRLRRGKQYARDGSVLDIEIERGVVTCEVQGSRATPYIASIEVTMGDGMPLRRDVRTICSCPDDDNWDGYACKHVIAAMFTFSDELLLEPELLDVWRGRTDQPGPQQADPDDENEDDPPSGTRSHRHLRLVGRAEPPPDEPSPTPLVDPLLAELSRPAGVALPPVPDLARADHELPRDPQLSAVLREAIGALRIDWG